MGALVALLVCLSLLVVTAACWKRFLGLAVTRFAHGRAFSLSIGQFYFAGLADLRLVLHVGPVREISISRLSVRLSSVASAATATHAASHAGRGDGRSSACSSGSETLADGGRAGSLWQALLSGQLLLPVQLSGVCMRLAPATPQQPAAQQAPRQQAAAATGVGASSRRGRKAQPPLWLAAHLPLQLDGLTIQDEARGVQLHLRRAALSLHTAQQLLLEGLSASLMPEPQAAEPDSGPSRSSPAVRRPQQGDPFLVLQQLALEHRHDGSSTFQQLLLGAPAAAGADAKPALQSVSVQLGATSLTVSAQLVRWAHRQRSLSRQAAGRKVGGGQPALAAELRLERLLSLLPKEVEVAAESCTVTTAGTDAHAASGLPLQAVFGLRGVSCRLAKAVAVPPCAGEPSPGSSGATPALACVAAGWQELSLSLGAASCQLPAAVQLSSGGAEWSVELSAARPGASQLAAVGRVGIGALTTRVCHPAVQPLVHRLRSSIAALQAAVEPGADHAGSSAPAAPASQQPNGKPRSPPLLAEWQGSVTLGDGSRLLFTDAEARCCWSCGLESCRLAVQASGGRIRSSEESEAGEPGGVSLVASFEAAGIEMHALASAASGLGGADPSGAPPQMLAAKLLRVHVEHAQQPSLDHLAPQQQPQQGQGQPASKEGPAVDATTAGVHVLLQQQQLSQVASVIVSLLPAPAVAAEAAGAADADPLTQVAAAAAAAGSKRRVSGLFRPRLSFSCSDTLLLLPVTVALPADQTPSGQLQLLPAAPALLLSSVGGRLAGGGASASAEGCTLLYCEGPLSQRFPSSTDALKEQARAAVVSLDSATYRQADAAEAGVAARDSVLKVGSLAACCDADALLCLAATADHAAQQLAAALAAAPAAGRPVRRRSRQGPARAQRRQALRVSVGQLRVAQLLYAPDRCRDMVLEVAAVEAVLGAEGGCQHGASTATAVLSMAGTPVLRWRELAASLRLPQAAGGDGGRLTAQPLVPLAPPDAATPRGGDEAGDAQEVQPEPGSAGGSVGDGGGSYEAYHRARLEAWLDADAATAPSAARDGGAAAAALGAGPASVMDVRVSGVELLVPHDGEPGPTQRYAELYFKALETAMKQHLQQLRQLARRRRGSSPPDDPGGAGGGDAEGERGGQAQARARRSLFPMQINLAAQDAALRFEHHPMEAWLASRGPLLQQLAVQQHLWGEVAAAVQPADTASPLHAGMVESAFETAAAASQQAWEGLLRDMLLAFRSRLAAADAQAAQGQGPWQADDAAAAQQRSGGGGVRAPPARDLMWIGAQRVQALLVVCCGSQAAREAAAQAVAAADPPSAGVPFSRLLKLHVDAALQGFAMRLAGTSRPFVATSHAVVSGTAAVARQATAPPQTRERRLPVGAHRQLRIPATVKGCRPPFKFFTDLSLEAQALAVCHSQGLDPTMALVALAGKRLSPSDPDRSVPRPPPIPWWDDMRYMWRGPVELRVASFGLTLGGTPNPDINDTSERMEVEARDVSGVLLSGSYRLAMGHLAADLHRLAGVQQLGGTLMALPFVRAPRASVRLDVDWKLPGGRPAAQHHIFPLQPPPAGTLQEPVYAGVVYKADSWDLSLSVELGQAGDAAAGVAPAPAIAFMGAHQIQWMKQFVGVMQRLPPHLRASARRGSFFWRKPPPPPGPPKRGIGKLTQKLRLHITASPLEVVHFAADPADPSHGIHLHAPAVTYAAAYALNQPLPSFLRLPPHARSSRARRPDPTRTLTLSMEVAAGDVTVHKAHAQRRLADGGASGVLASGPLASWSAVVDAVRVEEEVLDLLDDVATPATREQEPIIAAGTVAVTQDGLVPAALAAAPGGEPVAEALAPPRTRPLRVLIGDCRVLVDRAARDAVWGAVEHLISAFTSSPAQLRRSLASAAAHPLHALPSLASPTPGLLTSPCMPWSLCSPAARLQRQVSESQSDGSNPQPATSAELPLPAAGSFRRSLDGQGSAPSDGGPQQAPGGGGDSSNELLALLLEQRAAAEEAGGGELGSPSGATDGAAAGLVHPGATEEEGDEEARPSVPLDDLAGQLQYSVEVQDLQISVEAEAAAGRLLLAARSGRLQGLRLPDAALNVTALLMEEVSAWVTQTDVDPNAGVVWLRPTPAGYELPPARSLSAPARRIFEPILISLRHSKASGAAAARQRSAAGSTRGGRPGLTPGSSFVAAARGEELVLRVPEVLAVMDSREFEVLVDVATMLQSPGPSVDTVGAEVALLAELEGDEVEEARRLYALLRQQLAELRQASFQLRSSLGLQAFTSQLAPPSVAAGELLPPLAVSHFLSADSADFLAVQFGTAAELAVAMREHLTAASAAAAEAAAGGGGGAALPVAASPVDAADAAGAGAAATEAPAAEGAAAATDSQSAAGAARRRLGERQAEQAAALLLRWVEEQEGGAYEAVEQAKSSLLALKAVARKRQHKTSAFRLRLQLDRVVWQMCTLGREPLVQAIIRRLSLDRLRNKDLSGSAKFVIGRVEVLDSTGVLGPGPGIGAGVILSVWNPDASWERDDVLRVVASMGVPTQDHVVYDHLDVILHPIAFHLTEGIAAAFWEYFFPREDGAKARAAAAFARSVAVPAAAAARHRRSATTLPGDLSSQQGSPVAGSPMRRAAGAAPGDGSSQPGSGQQSPRVSGGTPRGAAVVNSGWRSAPGKLHRRTSSLAEASLSRTSTMGGSATATAAAAAAAAALLEAAAEGAAPPAPAPVGAFVSLQLQRTSASGLTYLSRSSITALEPGGGSGTLASMAVAGGTLGGGRLFRPISSASLAALEESSSASRSSAAAAPHRKVRFVHVKINRAHCRATYEGYPVSFTDLKLVIDNRTYQAVEGRWRDLFQRVKWDVVKSVVKSVAGLQGRKFKELLPEGFGGEGDEGGGRRRPGLLAQLQALGKGRREGGGEDPAAEEESLRAQYKRRMLFGQMPPPNPGAAAAAGGRSAAAVGPSPPRPPASPPVLHSPSSAASPAASPAPRSAAPSGSTTPRGLSGLEEVAGVGGVFPGPAPSPGPLGAAAQPGPLASGAFGSAALAHSFGGVQIPEVEAPPVEGIERAGALPGPSQQQQQQQQQQQHEQRGHLTTPRWAAKLASKAQKGLNKLRDSLQD